MIPFIFHYPINVFSNRKIFHEYSKNITFWKYTSSSGLSHQYIPVIFQYPLVNCPITMENHHFQWVNPLFLWPFSIAMLVYQRVDLGRLRPFLDSKCSYLWCFSSSQPAQPTYSDMSSQPPPWYPKR